MDKIKYQTFLTKYLDVNIAGMTICTYTMKIVINNDQLCKYNDQVGKVKYLTS